MAGVRERGGRFLGYYKVAGQQKGAGTYDTYGEALEAATTAETAARGELAVLVPGPPDVLTVAGYMPGFIENHDVAEITRQAMRQNAKHVVRELGTVALTDLTPAMVRSFRRSLQDGPLATATVGKVLSVLRVMCRTAVTDGLMTVDPTVTIKGGGGEYAEMRILSDDEYAAILQTINSRYTLLVRVLWATGMRWSEAIAIRPDAVYSRGGRWFVKMRRTLVETGGGKFTLQNHGKTKSATREISIPESLARELLSAPVVDGWIFRAVRGGNIHRSHFRREWRRAQKAAGISEFARVHDIRHTAISRWANAGISLVEVRDRAGHTDISTTSRYLHRIDKGEDPFLPLAA